MPSFCEQLFAACARLCPQLCPPKSGLFLFFWMDLLFIVPSDFCLLSHKAKSLPNLSSSLPLVWGLENTAQLEERWQIAGLVGRHYIAPAPESRKASGVYVWVCVCICVQSVFMCLCGTGPDPPFTAHWLNMFPGQRHQLVFCATYQTDTCRRNYGMSIARPNPNITSRPLVLSFNYQMSTSQGNCSFQSHARGLGKETLKGLWHRVSI